MHLAAEGEPLKTCPKCSKQTHRTYCTVCKTPEGEPLPLSGDTRMDDAIARIEAGEEIEDLEAFLRGSFEPVPR